MRANFANSSGVTHGPWITPQQTFTRSIHAPTGLTTLAPTGTAHVPVLLSWAWKAGAKTYKVEVSRDSSFVSSVESAEIDTSSWAPLMSASDYSNGGLLYWHVQAIDSHGTHGTWSPATPLAFANKLVPTASTTVIPHGATATVTITVKDGLGHVVPGAKVTASGAGVVTTSKLTGSTGKAVLQGAPHQGRQDQVRRHQGGLRAASSTPASTNALGAAAGGGPAPAACLLSPAGAVGGRSAGGGQRPDADGGRDRQQDRDRKHHAGAHDHARDHDRCRARRG